MISARTQLFVLAFTIAVAAGGLFIPVPRRDATLELNVLATRSEAANARALVAAAFPAPWRVGTVTTAPADGIEARFERGLRPDLVIAADDDQIERLVRAGRLNREGAIDLYRHALVIVRRKGADVPPIPVLTLLARGTRVVAICDPSSAVGRTSRDALRTLGLWFQLLRQRKLVRAETPVDAIARVRSGAADAAIVTLADVGDDPSLDIIRDAFPPQTHTPLAVRAYPVVDAQRATGLAAFRDYLDSDDGRLDRDAISRGERPAGTRRDTAQVWRALLLSLRAACLALMVAFPFGLLAAALLARRRGWWAAIAIAIVDAPLVVPPVVIGVALGWLFARQGWLSRTFGLPLAHTWQAGALAAAVVAIPFITRPIRRALEAIDPRQRRVAETLTPSRFSRFLLISFPLAGHGVTAGLLMGFARAFGEFGATLVIAANVPAWSETLPVAIRRTFESGDASTTWALVGAVLVPTLALGALAGIIERRAS